MTMQNAGYASLQVVPSIQNIKANLTKSVTEPLESEGDAAGQKFGSKFGLAMTGALTLAALRPVKAFISDIVAGASNLNETANKVQVVFGDATASINTFANQGAASLGLSKQAALDAASTFGVFGKSAQLTGAPLAEFSTGLTGLSVDLASFYNTSPEDAILAIGAALRGESEPIRRYGVLLDDATLKNRALALGLISSTKDALTPQNKVLAAQAEILAQTSDAQGDFARTSDGLANQQRTFSASIADVKARLGDYLLPVFTKVTGYINANLFPALDKYLFPALDKVRGVVVELWQQFKDSGALETITTLFSQAYEVIRVFFGGLIRGTELGEFDGGLRRVNDAAFKVRETLAGLWEKVKAFDFAKLWQQLRDGAEDIMPALATAGRVLGDVFKFIADHSDLLIKALPYVAAAFLAIKGAQLLNNIVGRDSLVGFAAQLVSTAALTVANNNLARSMRAVTATTVQATTASNTSALTRARETIAMIAQRAASMALKVAQVIATAAQWAWNLAMTANPVGLIIAAVVALIAAIVYLWNNNEAFRSAMIAAWDWIKAAVAAVVDWFQQYVAPVLAAVWDAVVAYVQMVADVYRTVWDAIWAAVSAVVDWFQQYVAPVIAAVWAAVVAYVQMVGEVYSTVWNAIWTVISAVVSWIVDTAWPAIKGAFEAWIAKVQEIWGAVSDAFGKVLDFVRGMPQKVKDLLIGAATLLLDKGREWVQGINDGIVEKATLIWSWFTSLGSTITGYFSSAGTLLKDAGKRIISGLLEGITDKFEDVKDFVGGIGSWIADNKGPKAYDLKLLVPAGKWIMTGFGNSLEDGIPSIKRTLARVSDAVRLDGSLSASLGMGSARVTSGGNVTKVLNYNAGGGGQFTAEDDLAHAMTSGRMAGW